MISCTHVFDLRVGVANSNCMQASHHFENALQGVRFSVAAVYLTLTHLHTNETWVTLCLMSGDKNDG